MDCLGSLRELARDLVARPEAAAGQLLRVRDEVARVLLTAREQLQGAFALAEQDEVELLASLDEFASRWRAARTFEELHACLPQLEALERRVDEVLTVDPQEAGAGEAATGPIVERLEAALNALVEHCRAGGREPLERARQALAEAESGLSRVLES